MEARNSVGRKISLLNDDSERPTRLLSSLPHHHPNPLRTSSYASSASTSSTSPEIPHLVRSDSTDSRAMQTPSPITPTFSFDPFQGSQHPQELAFGAPYFHSKDSSLYPPIPQQSTPYYPAVPLSNSPPSNYYQASPSPSSESQQLASQAATSASKPASSQKKNSYPCPLAKQYSCKDHFTTSGHAARHAKKHTGKKDAFCPECNKAFTRKDNMEQHRRTHQNGRSSGRSVDASSRKVKKQQQRPRPPPLQASLSSVLDPSLPVSPASSFGGFNETLNGAVQPAHAYPQDLRRSGYEHMPYPSFGRYEPVSPVITSALDTLAIAASSDMSKRKF